MHGWSKTCSSLVHKKTKLNLKFFGGSDGDVFPLEMMPETKFFLHHLPDLPNLATVGRYDGDFFGFQLKIKLFIITTNFNYTKYFLYNHIISN